MKKNVKLFLPICLLSLLFPLLPVYGVATDAPASEQAESAAQLQAERQEQNRQRLQSHGDTAIQNRLQSLTQAQERLDSASRLSDTDRSEIADLISQNKSGLVSLQAEIDAEQDVAALLGDVQGIYYDYRVYGVLLPKLRALEAAGVADYVIANSVEPALTKLETALQTAREYGLDTTELEALQAQVQSQLQVAKQEIEAARTQFRSMQAAEDYSPAQTALQAGKANLSNAKDSLVGMRQTVRQMIQKLQALVQ